MLSIRDPFQTQRHLLTERKVLEKDIPCKWKSKESRGSILIPDNIHVKIKTYKRQERIQDNYQGSIQEDITIVNTSPCNIGACQYRKQILRDHIRGN